MSPRASSSPARRPSLRVERSIQREGYAVLAGMDEVGRGALAGPVSVGVVLVGPDCASAPTGVKDSKLLTAAAREALVPRIRRWAPLHGVGHAWSSEIDAVGIMGGLRLAARRALAAVPVRPDLVLLDGNHDWFTDPMRAGLFSDLGLVGDEPDEAGTPSTPTTPVRTLIKGDMRCSSVAAASVLAKVERDAIMRTLGAEEPRYGWIGNKGYAAPDHQEALRAHGPCAHHRRSWRLLAEDPVAAAPAMDSAVARSA